MNCLLQTDQKSRQNPNLSAQAECQKLSGFVERVTYHNHENGYCVLRLNVKGENDLVTMVGFSSSVSPGEYVSASGGWINDRE